MNKKGDASQVFIYAISAVVAAMVLIFGYKAIFTVSETGKTANTVAFKKDMADLINRNSGYGKLDIVEVSVPGTAKRLCFIEGDSAPASMIDKYPEAQDIAESPDNAFIVDEKGNPDPFLVPNFNVDSADTFNSYAEEESICYKVMNGKASITFEGRGDMTVLKCPEADACE